MWSGDAYLDILLHRNGALLNQKYGADLSACLHHQLRKPWEGSM